MPLFKGLAMLMIFRSRLLLKQKLGLFSLWAGLFLVAGSFLFAQMSFLNFGKMFWDFSLGVIFLLQSFLAIYLGTQIFSEESQRRTLHLFLSYGVSRVQWMLGQLLGLWMSLTVMGFVWFLAAYLVSFSIRGSEWVWIALQSQVLLSMELLLLLSMGFFLSLFLRPLLSLFLSVALWVFLHSLGSVQEVLSNGDGNLQGFYNVFLFFSRLLPPLHWFDLRFFVGYEAAFEGGVFLALCAVALIWSGIFWGLSYWKFEKMDL